MKEFLNEFKKKYSLDDIKKYIDDIKDLSILVVGEVIIDEYIDGITLGKSGKFPIVAFQNLGIERYEGGVLAIRNHLKTYVSRVDIMTSNSAIVKRRYIQENQKLFETYYKESIYRPKHNDIEKYDIVMICDFGHGLFTKKNRELIRDKGKFIALNTQFNAGNEGLNTIQKYNYNANYICIDSHELRLAYSNNEDTVEEILRTNFKSDNIISITNGSEGCITYRKGELYNIPAFATKIVDKVGAGDAFFSITTPLAFKNLPIDIIGFIGNCVGAVAVGYKGNKESVTKIKLLKFVRDLLNEG